MTVTLSGRDEDTDGASGDVDDLSARMKAWKCRYFVALGRSTEEAQMKCLDKSVEVPILCGIGPFFQGITNEARFETAY